MEALNARISVHFLLLLLRRGSRSFFLLSLILLLQGGLGLTARGSVRRILHSHYLTSEIVVAKNGMSEKCKSWLRNAELSVLGSEEGMKLCRWRRHLTSMQRWTIIKFITSHSSSRLSSMLRIHGRRQKTGQTTISISSRALRCQSCSQPLVFNPCNLRFSFLLILKSLL